MTTIAKRTRKYGAKNHKRTRRNDRTRRTRRNKRITRTRKLIGVGGGRSTKVEPGTRFKLNVNINPSETARTPKIIQSTDSSVSSVQSYQSLSPESEAPNEYAAIPSSSNNSNGGQKVQSYLASEASEANEAPNDLQVLPSNGSQSDEALQNIESLYARAVSKSQRPISSPPPLPPRPLRRKMFEQRGDNAFKHLNNLMLLIFYMYKQHFTHITNVSESELPEGKLEDLPDENDKYYQYYIIYNDLYDKTTQSTNIKLFAVTQLIVKYFTKNKNNPINYNTYFNKLESNHKKQIIELKKYIKCSSIYIKKIQSLSNSKTSKNTRKILDAANKHDKCRLTHYDKLLELVYPKGNTNIQSQNNPNQPPNFEPASASANAKQY
jgi:hypothetical protein